MKNNAKNIRVFPDWFGIDTKSKQAELEFCQKLYLILSENKWDWSSDKSGFWVEQNSYYFRHRCDNGKIFNYPIEIHKDFKINDRSIIKIDKIHVGPIQGSESKRMADETLDPHYIKMAQEDLSANPTKEETVDWEYLKQQIDGEVI